MKPKFSWKLFLAAPAVLSTALMMSSKAIATETPITTESTSVQSLETASDLALPVIPEVTNLAQAVPSNSNATLETFSNYSNDALSVNPMEQVTSVSQLRDVQPTDWAFQALQSLVERYGCIVGYPDGTYRGNRPLTRYEFAAGLNACLDRVSELISRSTENLVTREDLEALRRLQEEFAAELATLRGRVDALEARTAELEANQFSTTTKLRGEAIFAAASLFGDEKADGSDEDLDDNAIFAGRVRLNFDTSFTGRDRLRTRLQAGNITSFADAAGTNEARLGFDTNTNNNVVLDTFNYRFPVGPATIWLEANAGDHDDMHPTLNPFFDSTGNGAISRFGQRNPVFRIPAGIGAGVTFNLSRNFVLSGSYMAPNGNNPADKAGLFDGTYGALVQLAYVGDRFGIGASYGHTYMAGDEVNLTGSTGSYNARRPFGSNATSADLAGVQGYIKISPRFVIGGWGGYANANEEDGGNDDATLWNWAVTLAFPDLGKKGNLLGFIGGMPPKVTSGPNDDPDTGYHLEAFYKFQVNNNISITPGAFVLLNPNHNDSNDTIVVGTIRTTFSF